MEVVVVVVVVAIMHFLLIIYVTYLLTFRCFTCVIYAATWQNLETLLISVCAEWHNNYLGQLLLLSVSVSLAFCSRHTLDCNVSPWENRTSSDNWSRVFYGPDAFAVAQPISSVIPSFSGHASFSSHQNVTHQNVIPPFQDFLAQNMHLK